MRRKLIVAASLVALAVSSLAGVSSLPARAATFKYDFETCEHGWKSKSADTWARSDLLDGGGGSAWSVAYLAYKDGHERAETITSLPHQWAGGKFKVSYDARWQMEPQDYGNAGQLMALDKVVIEQSTDGGKNWKLIQGHGFYNDSFPEFDKVSLTFDAPAGQVLLRFGLISDGNTPGLGFQFDNLEVPTSAPDGAVCK